MSYRARVEGGTEPGSVRSCCSSLECARPLTSRLALRVHPTQCCRFVSRFLSILDLAWIENRGEFRWLRQCSQIGTGETAETGQLWGSSCPTIEAPDGIRIRQFGIQAARSQVGSRGSGRVCACPWFCRGRLRGSQRSAVRRAGLARHAESEPPGRKRRGRSPWCRTSWQWAAF